MKETIGWGWKIKATQLQLVYFPLGGVRAVKTGGGILKKCLNLNVKLGLIKLGLRKPRQMEF